MSNGKEVKNSEIKKLIVDITWQIIMIRLTMFTISIDLKISQANRKYQSAVTFL